MSTFKVPSKDTISYLIQVLLKFLRHSLLETPRLETKIGICDSIHDTAHALFAIESHTWGGQPTETPLLPSAAVAIGNQTSQGNSFSARDVEPILSYIDGQSSEIQLFAPYLSAVIRRAIETTIQAYGITGSTPCHISKRDANVIAALPSDLVWPALPVLSAREPWSRTEGDGSPTNPNSEILRELHGNLFGIEVCAAEVCAAMPLRFPELPLELDLSLARQTYEEGRHARLLLTAFSRRGGRTLDYEPSQIVWKQVTSGNTLVEMLCIEQLLGEGHSLGSDLMAVDEHERNGQFDLAQIHLSLHADEMTHVAIGTTWVRRLAGEEYDQILLKLEPRFAVTPPPEPWFRADLRKQAGFTDAQIARQRERMLAGADQQH